MPDQGDDYHPALPTEERGHAISTVLAGAEIIRADKKNAPRFGCVGVNANNGDALQNGIIDGFLEQFRIRDGNHDARGMLRDCLLEGSEFLAWRKRCGPDEIHFYAGVLPDVR